MLQHLKLSCHLQVIFHRCLCKIVWVLGWVFFGFLVFWCFDFVFAFFVYDHSLPRLLLLSSSLPKVSRVALISALFCENLNLFASPSPFLLHLPSQCASGQWVFLVSFHHPKPCGQFLSLLHLTVPAPHPSPPQSCGVTTACGVPLHPTLPQQGAALSESRKAPAPQQQPQNHLINVTTPPAPASAAPSLPATPARHSTSFCLSHFCLQSFN